MRSPNFFVPGVIGVVLQIATTFATAMSLVRERERGTLEQLMVSPLSRWGLMLGKLTPYLCIGMLMAVGLFAVMRWLFNVPIAGNVGGLMFATFLYVFCFVEPRPPHLHQRAKPDSGPANVHDLHSAFRVFLRIYFSARNHAGNFLRHRLGPARDLLHRT